MKKLVAAFIFFTLLASGAFADFSLSGLLGVGATFLKNSSAKNTDLYSGGLIYGRLQANYQNDDETIGGVLRLAAGQYAHATPAPPAFTPYAWVWWKPIEQVRLQIGFIDDYTAAYIVGWEYHFNDSEDYNVVSAGYDHTGRLFPRETGFYSGIYWNGVSLTLTPFNGLKLLVAVPFRLDGDVWDNGTLPSDLRAENSYQYTHAQAAYTIEETGRITVSFTGGGNGKLEYYPTIMGYEMRSNASTFYASFLLTAIKNIDMNFGVAYTLPAKGDGVTFNSPVAAGFGFGFDYGKFTLKTRLAATFMGSARESRGTFKEPLKLAFGILPSYGFGPLRLYFNTGLSFKGKDEIYYSGMITKANDSFAIGWHLNPYVCLKVGPGTIFGGVRVESDGVKYAEGRIVDWGIPIGIQLEF